jgi:hypothetical protein
MGKTCGMCIYWERLFWEKGKPSQRGKPSIYGYCPKIHKFIDDEAKIAENCKYFRER